MKKYQDADPLHGNGKAIPKPKRPTTHSHRHGYNTYARGVRNCCINGHGEPK